MATSDTDHAFVVFDRVRERVALSRGELWAGAEPPGPPRGRSLAFCAERVLRLPEGKRLAGDLELVDGSTRQSAWGGAQ